MTKARSLSDFIESDGSVTLVDNQKIKVGTGNDLEIYHDGSNSYIDDAGVGVLAIRSNSVRLQKYTGEEMVKANADGAVTLYYDNSPKLETTSTGVDVTGGATFSDDLYIPTKIRHLGDTDTYLTFANADDFRIVVGNSTRAAFNTSEIHFNQEGLNQDFKVESNNNANMLFVDGGNDAVLVGKSSDAFATAGAVFATSQNSSFTRDGGNVLALRRNTDAGDMLTFYSATTKVGSIGNASTDLHIDGTAGHSGIRFQQDSLMPRQNGADINGAIDLGYDDGATAFRFKDLYLSGEANIGSVVNITSNTPKVTFLESDQSNKQYQIGSFGSAYAIYDANNSEYRYTLTSGGTHIFNEGGLDCDFRVESNTNAYALYVNGGNNSVGINTSSPDGALTVVGTTTSGDLIARFQHGVNGNNIKAIRVNAPNASGTHGYVDIAVDPETCQGGLAVSTSSGGLLAGNANLNNAAIIWDSNKVVTTPHQPAFRVARTGNYTHVNGNPIAFNTFSGSHHFNNGNHYSTSTYRFTAPVDGVYTFHTCILYMSVSDGTDMGDSFRFAVNGSVRGYSERRAEYVNGTTGNGAYYADHATDTYKLSAGDYVEVIGQKPETVHGNDQYTRWEGHLVG